MALFGWFYRWFLVRYQEPSAKSTSFSLKLYCPATRTSTLAIVNFFARTLEIALCCAIFEEDLHFDLLETKLGELVVCYNFLLVVTNTSRADVSFFVVHIVVPCSVAVNSRLY
jgi:hypothetical protein